MNGQRKRAGEVTPAPTPTPPQVTAAAAESGGDTAAAVQGTWGRGSHCHPSRSCGADNLGGTLREPCVFPFGGGGVEKRNWGLGLGGTGRGSETFRFISFFSSLKHLIDKKGSRPLTKKMVVWRNKASARHDRTAVYWHPQPGGCPGLGGKVVCFSAVPSGLEWRPARTSDESRSGGAGPGGQVEVTPVGRSMMVWFCFVF